MGRPASGCWQQPRNPQSNYAIIILRIFKFFIVFWPNILFLFVNFWKTFVKVPFSKKIISILLQKLLIILPEFVSKRRRKFLKVRREGCAPIETSNRLEEHAESQFRTTLSRPEEHAEESPSRAAATSQTQEWSQTINYIMFLLLKFR